MANRRMIQPDPQHQHRKDHLKQPTNGWKVFGGIDGLAHDAIFQKLRGRPLGGAHSGGRAVTPVLPSGVVSGGGRRSSRSDGRESMSGRRRPSSTTLGGAGFSWAGAGSTLTFSTAGAASDTAGASSGTELLRSQNFRFAQLAHTSTAVAVKTWARVAGRMEVEGGLADVTGALRWAARGSIFSVRYRV